MSNPKGVFSSGTLMHGTIIVFTLDLQYCILFMIMHGLLFICMVWMDVPLISFIYQTTRSNGYKLFTVYQLDTMYSNII